MSVQLFLPTIPRLNIMPFADDNQAFPMSMLPATQACPREAGDHNKGAPHSHECGATYKSWRAYGF
jgi:hypothetical protein